jgi:hypothetical protein
MDATSERRRASIVEALQPQDGGRLTVDRIWAAAALVLENIYVELNKRLEQLRESLEAKLTGPDSPTGDALVAYNKARVQYQADCAKVLAKFHNEFGEAKLKYEKELAKSSGREVSTAALQRVFDKYARKVTGLQNGMAELVAKGNSVLDTPQLSVTLLRYWAEHDRVMRQVYNSLIDLDSSTRSCTMDMSHEMQHITAFAQMLRQESADCFNAEGQFELGAGYGLPEKQLQVDEPTFSQPPQPKKVPSTMLSFAEESLAAAGAPLREDGGDGEDEEGPDAPQWSGGVSDRVLEGPLKKKSPAAGKGWQSRWFVLHGSNPARLSYFKRRTDDEPAGYINLELLAACFATTELKHDGKGIKLMMLDQRTYYLKASTPRDAQTWVAAISQAAARCSTTADGGGEDDHDGADIDDDVEPGSDDEESSSEEEDDDLLVPVDDAPGGITEEELRALQAEEAALLAANARLQQEVAQLESEVKGLL